MPQRASQSVSNRPLQRHERRDGHDIADIYEDRLLAHGLRSDDFIALRSSTELPQIPNIRPLRFGRGADRALLLPIAPVTDQTAPPVSADPGAGTGADQETD